MMHDLYIVGAGGLGRGLADALLYDNKAHIKEEFDNIYFVDDNNVNTKLNGTLVRYNIDDFINVSKECLVINAIGRPSSRKTIQNKLNSNPSFIFPNYIDSDVKVYPHVTLGEGNIITRGAVLSTNIEIGDFNVIHFNCTIGHDVKMGDYNCVYPLTSLSGYFVMGDSNMVGTNSSTLSNVKLGNENNIGASALLTKSISNSKTMIGSPATEVNNSNDNHL